jgi:hypothetical protein
MTLAPMGKVNMGTSTGGASNSFEQPAINIVGTKRSSTQIFLITLSDFILFIFIVYILIKL